METDGSLEGKTTETGDEAAEREAFLRACRDEAAARAFLEPVLAELSGQARALRQRWEALKGSLRIMEFSPPERVNPVEVREADFSAWEGAPPRKILSLDIFDTCLVRLMASPEAVFECLGAILEGETGLVPAAFAELRRETEETLRKAGLASGEREDTRLAAIYEAMGKRFGWPEDQTRGFLASEIRLEGRLLQPVEVVRERAWEWVRAGRRLVYTSEMYLPAETLGNWLREAGFPAGGCPVCSSGETGLSKGTGNLYRRCLEEQGSTDLLHVGDNPESDGKVPASLGLATAVIRTPHRTHADSLSNLLEVIAREGAPRFAGRYWESLGYRVAGPLHFAFGLHLRRLCRERGRDRVYFLSRDGWFPRTVFRSLDRAYGHVADYHYLYASREFLGLGSLREIGPAEWDFLLQPSPLLTAGDLLTRIGIGGEATARALRAAGLPAPGERVCHHWGFRDPRYRDRFYEAICANLPAFLEYRERLAGDLAAYLREMDLFGRQSLFVDAGWSGSSARSMRKLVPEGGVCPEGVYFGLFGEAPEGATSFFTGGRKAERMAAILKGSVALMEFLFGSPEPTIRGMKRTGAGSWTPVFRKAWPAYDRAAWEGLERGLMAFVEEATGLVPEGVAGNGLSYVEDVLRGLIFNPDEGDLGMLGPLCHGEGWGTDHRLRMIPRTSGGLSPGHLLEAVSYAPWKTGTVRLSEGRASGPCSDFLRTCLDEGGPA